MMRAFVAVCALWSALAVADDVLQTISPSVVKVPPDQDFATVLIAQSDRLPHGRVLNVKPTVGLITSTARTFINGGATTEYASQVLATTLADGRYAHLLARSSRVFYEGQSRLPPSADPRLNDVTHALWSDVETFIGNTDFLVTPVASQAHDEPTIVIEPSVVAVKVTASQLQTPITVPKRVPGENLATFTVGADTGGVPDAEAAESDQESGREARKLSGFPLDLGANLARVTYYGFADFTTTVGDTIIVFSPSTAQPEAGHVTSIVGEPTLSEGPRVTQTKVRTQEIFIEPTPTVTESVATVAPETFSREAPLETLIQVTPSQETPVPEIFVEETPTEEIVYEEELEEPTTERATEAPETAETPEIPEENEISPPAEAPKLSTPTNEDIAKIFESLAKSTSVQETLVSGGATTIFFEDEPLAPSEVEPPRTITSGDCQDAEVLTYLTTFFLTDSTSVKTNEVTQCHTALSTGLTEHPPEMEASETTLGTTEAEETTTTLIEETTEPLDTTTETTDAITETTEAKEEIVVEPEVKKESVTVVIQNRPTTVVKNEPSTIVRNKPTTVLKNEPTKVVKNDPASAIKKEPVVEEATEALSDIELIYKTLYTTYTYLTTFFHESTSSVSTRKEVVTNVVTTTVTPAMLEDLADIVNSMVAEKQDGIGVGRPTVAYTPTPSLEDVARAIGGSTDGVRTLYTTYTYFTTIFVDGETDISSRTEVYTNYVTQPGQMLQTSEVLEIVPTASYSTMSRSTEGNVTFMVTDVRSSSSNGESEVINNQLEDQISSESNTDEILPSATLLLQTSYTTFTYFTTMYMGSTSSVVSRLDTVTNVVTETVDRITPDATLPITYFTTFTYWTTLFRDGTTTTTSREETVSNVVSETPEPSSVTIETIVATTPTTYFTTYTYFTTSYVGDETVLNSRFETVTNVVAAPSVETVTPETKETTSAIVASSTTPTGRAIDVNTVNANAIEDGRRNVISRNHGRIVDADGITTILFTTEGVGTLIDGLYAQIIESTSTVVVDDARTATPTTALPTGLVRLIDGTIVTNRTTTLYQSRVIGTVIDGRYAQIIESTSSYLIDRTMAPAVTTTATPTIEPTPEVTETTETEPPEVADTTRGGLFATRKRTFTPVIRPFSSRARPTFNPIKRKGATTSALTVTRTDLTPTIRATPASKVESKGRFTSRRISAPSSHFAPSSSSSSGSSSSRRFSRPRPIAPSSTRRPLAPQSTTAELPQEQVTTRAPSLRGLSRRPSLTARRTTTPATTTTTTPRARTPLRASFGNRTRIGSLFPPRALFRPQQTEIDQRLDEEEDENAEGEADSGGRKKRQAVEYGTRARYIGRRTTTTTTTTPPPYFRGSYRRTQPTSRRSQTTYRSQQSQRQRVTSRRPPTRTRGRTEAPEYNLPPPDGTLTVTHLVPVSTSVPNVINGNTQYRQIVTQSASVEIVTPGGYTVSTGGDGQTTTLLSKLTSLAPNGATEVIQLHLRESPTTTIIFTPTTIRGRRTSFSHIVPTTAYTVERMVSTVNIDANAPLANILLSQLLLGNLGNIGNFGNFGNLGVAPTPFANFGNLAVQPTPAQPATHYHTRSTTFVTTLTNELSTVLPLTFHGKQVLTTIYDRTLSTVTATEYITDTVVDAPPPSQVVQQPALNSLLLPLLLQQQASVQDTDAKLQAIEEDPKPSTSVVTLYVSGRTPGDFNAEGRLLLTTRIMSNGVGVIVAEPHQTLSATTVEGGMELTLPLEGTFAPTPTTTCTTQTPTLTDADGRQSTVETSAISPTTTTKSNSITNPFAALVPVISAMAGLLATIRRSDPVPQATPSATHPLYIPLPPSGTPPHRLTPPLAPPAARWLSEEAHRQLLGIPISPGDVITANSDVVIGRPTGLGPRAPPRRPAHILEIRKIPQVYHTDLPPTPLLVNLQPSQVANVLIPHATSAAVVVTTIETTPSLRRDTTAEVGRASERHEVLTPPDRLMPPKPPKLPPKPLKPFKSRVPPNRPPPPPPLPLDVMTPPAPRIDTQTEHNSLFAIRHRPVNVAPPPIRMPPKRFAAVVATSAPPAVTTRPTWTTPRTTLAEVRTRPTVARHTRPTARSTWPTEMYSWPTTASSSSTVTTPSSLLTPGRRTTIQTIFFEARSTERPKTTIRKTQKPTKTKGTKTTPAVVLVSVTKTKSTSKSTPWTTPRTTPARVTTPRSVSSFTSPAGWGEWQKEPVEMIKQRRVEKPRKPIEMTKYRVDKPKESDMTRHRLEETPEESIEITKQIIKKPAEEYVEIIRHRLPKPQEPIEITRHRIPKPEVTEQVTRHREKQEEPVQTTNKKPEPSRNPIESINHMFEEATEPTDYVNLWLDKPRKPTLATEYKVEQPREPTQATKDWFEVPIEADYTEYKVDPVEIPEYEILHEEIQTSTRELMTTPKPTEPTRSSTRFDTKSPTRSATRIPSRRTSTNTPFVFTTPRSTSRSTSRTTTRTPPTIYEVPDLHEFFFTTSKRPKPPKIITKSTFRTSSRPPVRTTEPTTSTSAEPMSIELVVGTASHARPSVHIVPAESPPARDEQEPPEVNRVLLGGVLIASPPQPTTQPPVEHPLCWPACRAHRNEVCQRTGEFAKCGCRAGFARMFPDRPCKPTYTYAMAMNLGRFGGSRLFWDAALASNTSARFHHMQAVAHEALHRTAMQSDLRDIYHGLYVSGFEAAPEAGSIQAHFYLQLSDSSDEKRLRDVFGKYLRASNLSLGGTDLFATDTAVEAGDFDECRHEALHDCSPYALCFNLRGTYTCSCREGYVDLSENALYPGRQCSAASIGCATCNFHGVCIPPGRCECFPWYGGATCRINLKALLIALATLAGVLVCVLVGCVLATGSRIAKRRCGALMVPVVALRTKAGDQRAIVDNVSETSEEAPPPPEPQEKEPSLTVMIPRAKYQSRQSVSSACETKLLSYLDASATASVVSKKEQLAPLGALVSAGFEVSATVGEPQATTTDSDWFDPRHEGYCRTVSEARSYDETTIQPSTKSIRSAHEANTMAERDGGSTFLLPHTHLYRPDKISDISGFDSL